MLVLLAVTRGRGHLRQKLQERWCGRAGSDYVSFPGQDLETPVRQLLDDRSLRVAHVLRTLPARDHERLGTFL